MAIAVLVNGARGRMGQEVVRAVRAEPDLALVGEADLGDCLEEAIPRTGARVVVDFTHPASAARNTEAILRAGARPVVGTSGFSAADISRLQGLAAELKLGGVIAPNFAIGAVLIMRFAAQAARFFPDVEVIELHHDQKADAPSGTAMKTAEMIADSRPPLPPAAVSQGGGPQGGGQARKEEELLPGARGGRHRGIAIHSVRLPGLVAHQEVILGGPGQLITLRHDSLSRASFMPGVILAVRRAPALDRLHYGLEAILGI